MKRSATPSTPGYVPALDGLRGLALLAVVGYHSDIAGFGGGFLGVEVFFVISGFIISAGLLSASRSAGRIDLARFWWRRARRLLPAIFVLLIGLLSYSLLFEPTSVTRLRDESLAGAGYYMNWYLVADGQSYFDTFARPSLIRHLWSLAVEEQFYIVWPVLLTIGVRTLGVSRFAVVTVLGAAGSTVLMAVLLETGADMSRLYYGTDTRASGFLFGAAFALMLAASPSGRVLLPSDRRVADAVSLAALLLLATCMLTFGAEDAWLYRGGFAITALATVFLIAASLTAGTMAQRALSTQPLRWLGVRSYGLYLWHWPVVLLLTEDAGLPFGRPGVVAGQLALTLALGAASYALVESPIRNGFIESAWRDRARTRRLRPYAFAAATPLVVLFVAGAALTADEAPVPAHMAQESVQLLKRPAEPVTPAATPPGAASIAPSPQPDRATCAEIAGTPYRSVTERDWYRAQCIPEPTPAGDLPAGNRADVISHAQPVSALQDAPGEPAPRPTAPPAAEETAPGRAIPGHVTAIGDSVMLGAAEALAGVLPSTYVDAAVGRQVSAGITLLRSLEAAGQLGDVVVVHLGNNGSFTAAQFDEIMLVAGPGRRVVFVTVKVGRSWEATNNQVLAAGVGRHHNAHLADWYAVSAGQAGYFWDDGIHLRPQGAAAYAALIGQLAS